VALALSRNREGEGARNKRVAGGKDNLISYPLPFFEIMKIVGRLRQRKGLWGILAIKAGLRQCDVGSRGILLREYGEKN